MEDIQRFWLHEEGAVLLQVLAVIALKVAGIFLVITFLYFAMRVVVAYLDALHRWFGPKR